MIKAKAHWVKKPKMTIDDKVLKKCVQELALVVKKKVKSSAQVFRQSGSLAMSIAHKVKSKNNKAYAVIGARSRWHRMWKNKMKIPNRYAKQQEIRHSYLAHNINSNTVALLRELIKTSKDLIKK